MHSCTCVCRCHIVVRFRNFLVPLTQSMVFSFVVFILILITEDSFFTVRCVKMKRRHKRVRMYLMYCKQRSVFSM